MDRIDDLPTVLEVDSTSPEEANKIAIERILENNSGLSDEKKQTLKQNLLEAPNMLPWTLNVRLVNLDNTEELEHFVQEDESIKGLLDENKAPSYASGRRDTIERIASIMNRIELIGLIAAGVLAVIAILVVFNTIRMAIYNRKEEIYMMRLVGASRWFIVGPFVVEASFYGIIASAIAGTVCYVTAFALRQSFGSTLDPTLDIMKNYWFFVACAFLVAGILIGVVSSLLATRKYLKHK
jgi:cell division transport system permease protein